MTGVVFDVKEMAVHDGPGLRTTVFLKGCPLHCLWCHNPEGLSQTPELYEQNARCRHCNLCRKPCNHPECQPFGRCLHVCPENCLRVSGRVMTPEELAAELIAGAGVMGDDFGGFTFSGGEPLLQYEFMLAAIERLPGYNVGIETSGYADADVFGRVIDKLDFVIMDLKVADPILHKQYTGVDNAGILRNFAALQNSGKPYVVRTPLIPGLTDTPENLDAIAAIVGDAKWEQLPYNAMAGAKYPCVGRTYPLADKKQ